MKNRIIHVIVLSLLAFAGSAAAHPLGNFSVNQFARIEVDKREIKLRLVFDMAEIPTFQETPAIDTDKNGVMSELELQTYREQITQAYLQNLAFTVNGEPVPMNVTGGKIWTENGAGDLPILKITWDIVAKPESMPDAGSIHFENRNYPDRIGWNEIVVSRAAGVNVYNSSAYGSGMTDELKAYPPDGFNAPLRERVADLSFTSSAIPEGTTQLKNRDGHIAAAIQSDKLAELISVPVLTPAIALFGFVLAFGFGALHAMSPGHGKTVVGAYLVGSRGTVKHAIFLGLTVTVTHTLGVFALGLITLFASNYILPEQLMPFLSFVSGLLVFFIGISLFKDRIYSFFGWSPATHDHSEHSHDDAEHGSDGHTHTHGGTTHTHTPPEDITWRSLLGLGISGGLLPCPSALVLMLSAISLGRVGYGLLLTIVFSFGLAATLTAVGLAFLYLGKVFGGTAIAQNRVFRAVPVFSALIIACVGAAICYSSLG